MESLLRIAVFNERAPAETICDRLRAAGFSADVIDESQTQKMLLMNRKPRAHMQVRVPKGDEDRAAQLLRDWDAVDGALRDAVRCPQCASSRVDYPQFSRRTLMSAFPAAIAAAGIIERQFYCEACGFTWEAEPKPEPKMDVLNWPEGTKVP